ncbi:hypothetical protein D3C73_1642280 [compost metagenome]
MARACVTYSSRSTSMVLARDMRVSTPVSTSTSVTIGKITYIRPCEKSSDMGT